MAKTRTGSPSIGGSELEATNGSGTTADSRSDSTIDAIGNSGIAGFNPADFGTGNGSAKSEPSTEPVKRGRGRPAGSGSKKQTQREISVAVTGTEKLLLGIHNMLAAGFKVEELAIDEKEAKMLSDAIVNVSQHYQTVIDPKLQAWLALLGIVGAIYVPRVFALVSAKKEKSKNEEQRTEQPANVMPFNPQQFAGG